MPNPWGDYGDVDLSSIYYGNQSAQAGTTGQPVPAPDGSNAPNGVDPATGLALPGGPAPDPEREKVEKEIATAIETWAAANGRDLNQNGLHAQELADILTQPQLDAAIQYGLFGEPGQPIAGGISKSNIPTPAAAPTAAPEAAGPPPTEPDPANDYSQEMAALDKYLAELRGVQSKVTSDDGSVTVNGPHETADPRIKVYEDRRKDYANRHAQYEKQKADYEAYKASPAGMAPSANPIDGQHVLSTDPNAIQHDKPKTNADGTINFMGYTLAGGSGPKIAPNWNANLDNSAIRGGTPAPARAQARPSPTPAQQGAGKIKLPGRPSPVGGGSGSSSPAPAAARDLFDDIQDRFEEVELRIRSPRARAQPAEPEA